MTSLGEIKGAVDFEPARLAEHLSTRLPFARGPMSLARISGGQSNPTYIVSFPDGAAVLRKKPAGVTLPSAHAVDREFRVLNALSQTSVPVPRALLYEADPAVIGTPFYLMDKLEGRVFHDCALPGIAPQDRRAMYFSMAETLAALHAVDPAAVGLGDFGRPGSYFARQLARWSRQWEESPTQDIPELDAVVEWLSAKLPADDGRSSVAHGDFRLGNLMFHPTEPRVVGILDWELATLGDPLADLGFCCMTWHSSPDEYSGILGLDLAGLGIPTRDAFVARYEGLAAPSGRLQPFHVVFALFRFSVIFVGIADRARAGTAADANAAATGRLAVNFARRAHALAMAS
ncbi:phosphotransferase family protein [uncultured Alsobacter sp.]|uniref:phosphotransferase family protein n=1 Tax=uncultured Alsobacter sp. TaxID=1748258 RepID=UPI0025E3B0BC|nr:phosphotransferase family protein [uncultured Alsobacter sp.]